MTLQIEVCSFNLVLDENFCIGFNTTSYERVLSQNPTVSVERGVKLRVRAAGHG